MAARAKTGKVLTLTKELIGRNRLNKECQQHRPKDANCNFHQHKEESPVHALRQPVGLAQTTH